MSSIELGTRFFPFAYMVVGLVDTVITMGTFGSHLAYRGNYQREAHLGTRCKRGESYHHRQALTGSQGVVSWCDFFYRRAAPWGF